MSPVMTDHPRLDSADDAETMERQRRRRVLMLTLLLLVGLPLYLILASTIVGTLTAPTPNAEGTGADKPLHWALEMLIYVVLGVIWAFPLKRLVQGVGRKT